MLWYKMYFSSLAFRRPFYQKCLDTIAKITALYHFSPNVDKGKGLITPWLCSWKEKNHAMGDTKYLDLCSY